MKLTTLILTVFLTSNLLAQELYTLETCETDIAYNVPQFYQDFFHCVKARVSESGDYVNLYFNAKPPYQTWYYDERNISSSDNPEEASIRIDCSFPVFNSLAETLRIPFASTSKVTSI